MRFDGESFGGDIIGFLDPLLQKFTVFVEVFFKTCLACEVLHFAWVSPKIDQRFANLAACIDTIFIVIRAEHAAGVVLGHYIGTPGIILLVFGKGTKGSAQ